MRAGSKSARMVPRLGLARLISAITAGFPAATLARSALSKPRAGGAFAASRWISASGTASRRCSTSRRFAARIRSSTWDTLGLREPARVGDELVELAPRGTARDHVARERHAVPEARGHARHIECGRGIEDDHVGARPGLAGQHRFEARARLVRVLHLARLD